MCIRDRIKYPLAAKDEQGRLLCGAAVGITANVLARVDALVKANVDVIVVDSAHGHSENILRAVREIKAAYPELQVDVYKRQLTTLIVNKLRGTFQVVAVKAPGYGDRRKEMLQDIAILTGGTVISDEVGLELKDATMAQLGRAKSVKVAKENTVIVDGMGDKEAIANRVAQILSLIHIFRNVMVVGELSLNGEVRSVSGVLPRVIRARELGCRYCIIPFENLAEGALVKDMKVVGVQNIKEVLKLVSDPDAFGKENQFSEENSEENQAEENLLDFGEICGQESARSCLLYTSRCV